MERRTEVVASSQSITPSEETSAEAQAAQKRAEFESWKAANGHRFGLDEMSVGDQLRIFERCRLVEQLRSRGSNGSAKVQEEK